MPVAESKPMQSTLLALLIFAAAVPSLPSASPVLTRIDATKSDGLTIVATAKGLTLETLDGSVAKTFPCTPGGMKITSVRAKTWTIKDRKGAGLVITDLRPVYLTIVNRGISSVAVTRIGNPVTPIPVPVHALTIINRLKFPVEITASAVQGSVKTYKMNRTSSPLTMVCPYVQANGKSIDPSFGIFAAHTDFGLKIPAKN